VNIVYISKYTVLPEYGAPTRQYFLSKYLSRINGNQVLLIGSRSTRSHVPPVKNLFLSNKTENLETIILDGPKIDLGFNLKRIWSWIVFELNIFRFRKRIKKFQPDIIIVSSLSILTFLSGVFLKKWLRIPLVIEIRDIYPLTLQEVGTTSPKNPIVLFLKWIEKIGYKNADLIISTLPNAKEHISSVLEKPINFLWLPMGIDPDYFNKNEGYPPYSLRKSENEFIIAYTGSFGKANALDTVFKTAEVLQFDYPNIRFIFIGDGPLEETYKEKYGYLKSIQFLPRVPKDELPSVLGQADILINTWLDRPIYRFGISPNKWMDYMYAGRPILVAFNGYRCIIEEAECGKFIEAENKDALAEAIIEFSRMNPDDLKRMGENGKNYLLRNLTYQTIAKNLDKKLDYVLSASKDFK